MIEGQCLSSCASAPCREALAELGLLLVSDGQVSLRRLKARVMCVRLNVLEIGFLAGSIRLVSEGQGSVKTLKTRACGLRLHAPILDAQQSLTCILVSERARVLEGDGGESLVALRLHVPVADSLPNSTCFLVSDGQEFLKALTARVM